MIISPFDDPKKNLHGAYWLVNGKKIYNKFEAHKLNESTGMKDARFVFMEDSYDKLDWTKEPSESWDYLCQQRALQLRQKYKKLKLFFSGGSDSGHIWQVFEKNNIPIDELILCYSDHHPLRLLEFQNYVYPTAIKLVKNHPETKIRIINLGIDNYDLSIKNDAFLEGDDAKTSSWFYVPHYWGWDAFTQDPDSNSLDTGYMIGLEKSRVQLYNNNYIFRHSDQDILFWFYHLPTVEYFYWAPDMPKLFLKQTWMVVNYLEKYYPDADYVFLNKFQDRTGVSHPLLYKEWCNANGRGNLLIEECGNGTNKMAGNYHWAIQQSINFGKNQNLKSYRIWDDTMQDLSRNWARFFRNNDPLNGFRPIFGKPYFIKIRDSKLIK